MNEFFQKDIISVKDFDKQKLESIFDATNKIIQVSPNDRREIGRGKTSGYPGFNRAPPFQGDHTVDNMYPV